MKILAAAESPFKRALVPLDGSRIAEAVLPVFLAMARPLQIEVALVRVVVPTLESTAVDESPEAFEASQQRKEQKRQEAMDYLRVVAAMPIFEELSVSTGGAPAFAACCSGRSPRPSCAQRTCRCSWSAPRRSRR